MFSGKAAAHSPLYLGRDSFCDWSLEFLTRFIKYGLSVFQVDSDEKGLTALAVSVFIKLIDGFSAYS